MLRRAPSCHSIWSNERLQRALAMALHFCFGSKTPQFLAARSITPLVLEWCGEAWTVYIIYCPLHQAAAIRMDAKWKTYIWYHQWQGQLLVLLLLLLLLLTGPTGVCVWSSPVIVSNFRVALMGVMAVSLCLCFDGHCATNPVAV